MNKSTYRRAVLLFVPIALIFLLAFNFRAVKDILTSLSYRPTPISASVEDSLSLTSLGSRIFRASHPDITSDFSAFSGICYQGQSATEVSIKGCYVSERIYVYDIDEPELSGIVESTSAHELLHAVWARLSSSEKSHLTPILESFYDSAGPEFRRTLESYPEEDRLEEIYVRSATQVGDLPDELEAHFARYFADQDAVVSYYDSYASIFLALEHELDDLLSRIQSLESSISEGNTALDVELSALESDIDSFNSCAETPGCFSDAAFWSQRNALVSRQSVYQEHLTALNSQISEHNSLVERYNDNILRNRSLETIINPNLENLEIK